MTRVACVPLQSYYCFIQLLPLCLHPLVTEKCIPDEKEAWVDQKADVHHLSEHAQNGIAVVELQIEQLGIWEEEMD